MKPAPLLLVIATATAAVACVERDLDSRADRLDLLSRAFEIRRANPHRATELFAQSGAGSFLERVRLEAWLEVLEEGGGEVARWRDFLATGPPKDLAAEATLGLARALANEGELAEAVDVLQKVPARVRSQADEMLVMLGAGAWQPPAARRLAVAAPHRLRRIAPDVERQVLPALSPEERLERSERWLQVGAPKTAVSELRKVGWRGDVEERRRLVVARAELAAGSPSRALGSLPRAARSGVDELAIRGEAYRTRAWQRVPTASARASFADCLETASRLVGVAETGDAARVDGLRLVVECGTETGALDRALQAWFELEAVDWIHDQREWLGRRLGVAIAQQHSDAVALDNLASTLPNHARCLRFWSALSAPDGRGELRKLAAVPISDIYGVWARQILGLEGPLTVHLTAAAQESPPPLAVRWLLDRGAAENAAREWRRIHSMRGSSPGEALAAAELARELGRSNEAIGWLRRAYPALGTLELWRVPVNVVHDYLPLPWQDSVRAAAAEAGIEPWLLAGVGRQESVFNPRARSPRGAVGVMQLMPGTAGGVGRSLGLGGKPDLYSPEINLRLGAHELARLLRKFGEVEPALAAYNAGETRARRWWRQWQDRFRFTEAIPIPETYNYVRRVTFLAEGYRSVYADVWRRSP